MSKNSPSQQMKKKMVVVMCIILSCLCLVCGCRLLQLMIFQGDKYSTLASNQQLSTTTLSADRGTIYDRNKNVLATSATVWTVYITPKDIETDEEARLIADGLAPILELDSEKIYAQTKKGTAYEKIKRRVEEPTAELVRAFISENSLGSIVGLDTANKRYYPNGTLASTILGFVGDDNQGLSGIEYQYDSNLEGIPGKLVASKNARGSDMPFNYETLVEAQQGSSLVLTIDEYVQYVAEKYLDEAVNINNATNRGCCIVMNVNSGEILAMATKPDFDPNQPFTIYSEADKAELAELEKTATEDEVSSKKSQLMEAQWKNKAIVDTYEPGSVFKIITGSAALEEKKVSMDSGFNCPGYIVIAGTRYNCHKTSGHGAQKFINIFENSCNPGFIEIGQRLGSTLFYNYFKAFGFTQKTGIDLPGEALGVYYTADKMGPVELASESFGQTFRITPIQMITAVAAACNGGYYVKPHVVKEFLDSDGNVTKSVDTDRVRQVVSTETSKTISHCLNSVVENGSGKNAYVAGYRMCGKTGTSQKIDKKKDSGTMQYVASFCGFAPADNPEYAIIVIVDEPHGASIYGSTVSAPVAGSIMSEILPYLGVEAIYTDKEYEALNKTIPNVVGKSVSEARTTLEGTNLKVTVKGDGETVLSQTPSAGSTITTGGTVVLYTTEDDTKQTVTVPDFTGMSVSQVNSTAASAGLTVSLSGIKDGQSGAVSYKQSVQKGESLEAGTVVTVYFRYTDVVE